MLLCLLLSVVIIDYTIKYCPFNFSPSSSSSFPTLPRSLPLLPPLSTLPPSPPSLALLSPSLSPHSLSLSPPFSLAWVNGVPERLIYPTDSKGRLCGVDPTVRDKPFLLFFDLTRCLQVVSVSEIVNGNFDASSLFTCPTPQVSSTRTGPRVSLYEPF